MSYQPPPSSGYQQTWPPSSGPRDPYAPQHDSLALGTTLGRLLAGQERAIFLHEATLQELRTMPERLAKALPTPAAPSASIQDRLITVREILKLLLPLMLLTAIITGKLTFIEAVPLIRQALGMAG